jgi:hypothetical protein
MHLCVCVFVCVYIYIYIYIYIYYWRPPISNRHSPLPTHCPGPFSATATCQRLIKTFSLLDYQSSYGTVWWYVYHLMVIRPALDIVRPLSHLWPIRKG